MIIKSENLNGESLKAIELTNVGPIDHLRFPLEPGGRVICFRGRNGSGKSTAIEAVSSVLSGNGKPPLKDGTKKGSVKLIDPLGKDAVINITATIRRDGKPELIVDHIEGRYSINDLVNPKHKGAAERDRLRIKSLLTVRGQKVDKTPFAELFENSTIQFEDVVSQSSYQTDDPVEMSGMVKRDVEQEARVREERSKTLKVELDAALTGTEYDPEDIIEDIVLFNETSSTLAATYQNLKDAQKAFKESKENIDKAKAAIASVDVSEEETLIETEKALIVGIDLNIDQQTQIAEMNRQTIDRLKMELKEAETEKVRIADEQEQLKKDKRQHERIIEEKQSKLDSLSEYREFIEKLNSLEPVDEQEVEQARINFISHNEKLKKHSVADSNKKRRDRAIAQYGHWEKISDEAAELREIARNCEQVLTDLIGDGTLFIKNERMYVQTHRGDTLYDVLSQGERWREAFKAVIGNVRKENDEAILTLPQEAWESLDTENQTLIRKLSFYYNVKVVTAQKSDGDLGVEILEPMELEAI